jgi:DNA polymerase-3 subunit epsilon
MNLIFDTETTGLPDFRSPSDAPHQPHLVQLAMILADAAGTEREAVNVMIKPDGWTIPDDVAKIHGIDQATAERFGIPESLAVHLFLALHIQCSTHVAHNLSFDRRIMRIAMLRAGMSREEVQEIEATNGACTLNATTRLLNLPPSEKMVAAGFNKPKPPKLAECIEFFFKEKLEGAHDAMVDVRACKRVHYHLQTMKAAA